MMPSFVDKYSAELPVLQKFGATSEILFRQVLILLGNINNTVKEELSSSVHCQSELLSLVADLKVHLEALKTYMNFKEISRKKLERAYCFVKKDACALRQSSNCEQCKLHGVESIDSETDEEELDEFLGKEEEFHFFPPNFQKQKELQHSEFVASLALANLEIQLPAPSPLPRIPRAPIPSPRKRSRTEKPLSARRLERKIAESKKSSSEVASDVSTTLVPPSSSICTIGAPSSTSPASNLLTVANSGDTEGSFGISSSTFNNELSKSFQFSQLMDLEPLLQENPTALAALSAGAPGLEGEEFEDDEEFSFENKEIDEEDEEFHPQFHVIIKQPSTSKLVAKLPKKRGKLPEQATGQLKKWIFNHMSNPYPSEEEKVVLCAQTGLSLSQLNNWFTNARRRLLKKAAKKLQTPMNSVTPVTE